MEELESCIGAWRHRPKYNNKKHQDIYLILRTSIGWAHIVPGMAPKAPTQPCCRHFMGSKPPAAVEVMWWLLLPGFVCQQPCSEVDDDKNKLCALTRTSSSFYTSFQAFLRLVVVDGVGAG